MGTVCDEIPSQLFSVCNRDASIWLSRWEINSAFFPAKRTAKNKEIRYHSRTAGSTLVTAHNPYPLDSSNSPSVSLSLL